MKKTPLTLIYLFLIIHLVASGCSPDEDPQVNPEGNGSLQINISASQGLQSTSVLVSGPNGFNETLSSSKLLEELAPGKYKVSASIIIDRSNVISLAYRPTVVEQTVDVLGNQQIVDINYILMPGSGKLWFSNQNAEPGRKIIGFDRSLLNTAGNPSATVKLTNSIDSPNGIAFDPLGNLWIADGSGSIRRFDWDDLGSNNVSPSKNLAVSGLPLDIAFDQDSTLWVVTYRDIIGFAKDAVFGSVTSPTFEITSPSFEGLQALAFDQGNNLWLANGDDNNILKLNSSKLNGSGTVTPDITLTLQSPPPVVLTLSTPTSLAFDANNNLMIGFFGPNTLVSLSPDERASSRDFEPNNQYNLPAFVLIEHMAFDEGNNLWLPYGENQFAKISAANITSGPIQFSSSSPDIKYGTGVAIYPPPSN